MSLSTAISRESCRRSFRTMSHNVLVCASPTPSVCSACTNSVRWPILPKMSNAHSAFECQRVEENAFGAELVVASQSAWAAPFGQTRETQAVMKMLSVVSAMRSPARLSVCGRQMRSCQRENAFWSLVAAAPLTAAASRGPPRILSPSRA